MAALCSQGQDMWRWLVPLHLKEPHHSRRTRRGAPVDFLSDDLSVGLFVGFSVGFWREEEEAPHFVESVEVQGIGRARCLVSGDDLGRSFGRKHDQRDGAQQSLRLLVLLSAPLPGCIPFLRCSVVEALLWCRGVWESQGI